MDDGYSGTNYDRPEFRRMCQDIDAGKVRCILTKDMSRLGRNSARTTDLLEEYFPAHQVRYIAVSEGYDSQNMTGGMAMTAPLMMVMNGMYARDISCKIRSAFQSKMENGEYIDTISMLVSDDCGVAFLSETVHNRMSRPRMNPQRPPYQVFHVATPTCCRNVGIAMRRDQSLSDTEYDSLIQLLFFFQPELAGREDLHTTNIFVKYLDVHHYVPDLSKL